MLKKILIGLGVLLLVLVVVIATRPGTFRYSRSRTMAVTPSAAFAQVNDFHKWDAWSPWAKVDPNCKNTFSGPESGKGAKFSWAGNNEVGEGAMTIIESRPPELIHINLEFIKPMPGVSLTEFTFKPEGDKTLVTWTMSGENSFAGKAISLVMDCEKMCGDMFDKGLEGIEKAAKSEAK